MVNDILSPYITDLVEMSNYVFHVTWYFHQFVVQIEFGESESLVIHNFTLTYVCKFRYEPRDCSLTLWAG